MSVDIRIPSRAQHQRLPLDQISPPRFKRRGPYKRFDELSPSGRAKRLHKMKQRGQ